MKKVIATLLSVALIAAPGAALGAPGKPPANAPATRSVPLSKSLTGEAKRDFDAARVLYEDGDSQARS